MALLDRQTLLSDNQAVTATAFTVDQYDTGNVSGGRNIARGHFPLRAVFSVDVAPTAAGAATVDFQIGEADDAAGTNFTIRGSTGARAIASLPLGTVALDMDVPDNTRRFIMGRYVVATGPLTAGQFTCALQIGSDFQRNYPRGDNASAY
jgi:hypothetical protein